jgi:hypothetical protein
MKKIITIGAIAAVLALAGCAVPVNDVETGPQAAPAPAAPAPQQDAYEDVVASGGDESGFIATLDALYPRWERFGPTSDAIGLGNVTCDNIAAGGVEAAAQVMWQSAEDTGAPMELGNAVFVSAVRNLCPEYIDDLDAWLSEDSATY